jgi:hypothetical protein
MSDSRIITYQMNKADTISLSDLLVKQFGLSKADIVTLSDTIVKKFGLNKSDIIIMVDANDISGIVAFIAEQLGLNSLTQIF